MKINQCNYLHLITKTKTLNRYSIPVVKVEISNKSGSWIDPIRAVINNKTKRIQIFTVSKNIIHLFTTKCLNSDFDAMGHINEKN